MEGGSERGSVVFEGPEQTSDHLVLDPHVLLRHRLLREAHGSEGLIVVEEELGSGDLAVADGPDRGEARVRFDAASLALSAPLAPRENSVGPYGENVAELVAEVHEAFTGSLNEAL